MPMTTRFHCLLIAACLLPILAPSAATAQGRDAYRARRLRMVREFIEEEGVTNERVLQAMRSVPRHLFVDPPSRPKAYRDMALPIGHRQTISPPFIVAYMTETIDPQPDDRVLEIGTGSGYQAAVLAEIVDEVYTIEIVEPLGEQAARRLKRLDYDNVTVKIGDGFKGWAEHAPFDKIIVTCSPEKVPPPLVEQLRDGGKMIIPLGRRYQQVFHLFEKRDGELVQKKLIPTLFVPMTGISEERRRVKPDPARPEIVNGSFESDSNKDGRPDGWHYQRQTTLDEDDALDGEASLRFENSERGQSSQALQGMAVDGRRVRALQVQLGIKCEDVIPGRQRYQRPALIVHFYDGTRQPMGERIVGPWLGTRRWRQVSETIPVPRGAREAIVRIGLNGAAGTLWVDDVRLSAVRR